MRIGSKSFPGERALVCVSLSATLLTAAGVAQGYCRTSSCPNQQDPGTRCEPQQPGDCGTAIFWPSACVGFSIQQDASTQVDLATAREVFHTAFETWMNADCGAGATPRIQLVDFGPAACDKHEYNQHAGNDNIFIFRDDTWPYEGTASTLALTTVTYNRKTFEIYNADMEINSANVALTTGDTNVKFDLRSIATHEAGHFLGLAHSPDTDATMFSDYLPGTTDMRTLSADDINGICAIYPPGAPIPDSCDPTPRHGFSTLCAEDQPPAEEESEGCCAVAPGSAGGTPAGGVVFAAATLIYGARRRKLVLRKGSRPASGPPR